MIFLALAAALPLCVCLFGLCVFIATHSPDPKELGKIMFWAGLSVFLVAVLQFSNEWVKRRRGHE